MLAYLDSSALVKLYVSELGSETVRLLTDTAQAIASSSVAYPEVRAAFARRTREGGISPKTLATMKQSLLDDWKHLFVVPVSSVLSTMAGDLAEAYALRGFDAIHLATALWLQNEQHQELTFACWDDRLGAAAVRAGLTVIGATPSF